MKIRVRKGITVKTVQVDSICSCQGHSVAQRVNSQCKIDYYTREAGELFWRHKNARKQRTNTGYIRRLI